ncbi:hypothetical protein [Nocardia sp. XZ_19_369]|uniref:hypothetical protein n=1 Tax=Nocardia sp. XZ_19_369 TaxID=2769487 RepID=UPI001E5F694D|nr:hypothetical protein [Nocardia sp. XZ_19_369]
MREKLTTTTPIIRNIDTGYLTFLTLPAPPEDHRTVAMFKQDNVDVVEGKEDDDQAKVSLRRQARLFRHAIRTVRGATITLPGPEDARREWLVEPDIASRADFDLVADITIEVAAHPPTARRS